MMPGLHAYGDNPVVMPQSGALHARALATLQSLVDTPLFAAWIYLLVCVVVMLAGASRMARHPRAGLAAAVAASSLAYALPFALASGSAEFRYLAWPVLATLAALVLMAAAKKRN